MKTEYPHITYKHNFLSEEETIRKSQEFYEMMDQRRSIRFFSDKPVPYEVIENVVKTAGTAPSGAHKQPWTYVVVSDKELKKKIRIAAEEEEKISYNERMTEEWLQDLAPIGTSWEKPYLEIAPYLIIVFKQRYGLDNEGNKSKHYYVNESVGIATGMLITAIHTAGLVTLTHTPSPMNFLTKILKRPDNETPIVLLPVGYPTKDGTVPDLKRKDLSEILIKM
jgi:iodotyrosine deiodinase